MVASLGSIGRRHLRNLRELRPAAEIAVLRSHTVVEGGALPEGANYHFGNLDEALHFAPMAAIVAGPSATHLEVASRFARSGVHILVEKPISDHLDGVNALIEDCRERGVVLMVGYNLRFLPSLQFAKRCIDQGAIGRVQAVRAEVGQYLPDWRPGTDYRKGLSGQAEMGGGVLLELSHELDYVKWFFGMPARVTARGGRYGDLQINAEDTVEVILEYESPARLVNVHLDMLQRTVCRRCRFVGNEGTLVWDALTDSVELYQVATGKWSTLDAPRLTDKNRMYVNELAHFIECVQTGAHPLVSGQEGRDVLALVEAAKRSMAASVTIRVEDAHGEP